jgi:hypothetical protein
MGPYTLDKSTLRGDWRIMRCGHLVRYLGEGYALEEVLERLRNYSKEETDGHPC